MYVLLDDFVIYLYCFYSVLFSFVLFCLNSKETISESMEIDGQKFLKDLREDGSEKLYLEYITWIFKQTNKQKTTSGIA